MDDPLRILEDHDGGGSRHGLLQELQPFAIHLGGMEGHAGHVAAWPRQARGQPAALIALGVAADEAQPYAIVLDGGGTLVSVVAADHQVDQVLALMGRYTTKDLAVQASPW